MDFNIMQWNSRSAVANKNNLEHFLYQKKINIALLSETWFKPNIYYNFSGFNCLRVDRPDGKGGVAILIKNNISYENIPLPSYHNIQINCACVKLGHMKLYLVSVYIKPSSRLTVRHYVDIFNVIPKPCLIGGDFNAHHPAWGSESEDLTGRNLLEAFSEVNLVCLNTGEPTLVTRPGQRKSAIDITICSQSISQLFDWKVVEDPHGSNHLPILMTYRSANTVVPLKSQKIWNVKKADWFKYSQHLNMKSQEPLQDTYVKLIADINEAANLAIPKIQRIKPHSPRNCKLWWTEECNIEVRKRREMYQNYKANPNLSNLIKYQEQDARVKKITNTVKRKSWKEYCLSLNKNTPMKEVWSKLNKFKNRKQSNSTQPEWGEWTYQFHESISPHWVDEEPYTYDIKATEHMLNRPFSMYELQNATKKNVNTSPGIDSIHYQMISELPESTKRRLLNNYNKIYTNSCPIPDDWHRYLIIPILKPGKKRHSPESYRPISLGSCIMKTYERLIKNRLEYWLERNQLIPAIQYGFRRGRSTQEITTKLTTDLQLALSDNKSVSALFIDIKGAYDAVNFKILTDKLDYIGLPQNLIFNIVNLYSNRQLIIQMNGERSTPRYTSIGLPQGSILSPMLFSIYTSDVSDNLEPHTKLIQFADDICLYVENKSIDQTIRDLSTSTHKISNWFNSKGFLISQEKSTLCTFTRRRHQQNNKIKIGPYEVTYKSSVKYLGIIFNNKLSWTDHINHLIKKCENAINVIRAFCHTKWGADPNIALIFYRALIRSVLDYGCTLYGNATTNQLKKVEIIKNKSLRISLGLLQSTPIPILEVEAAEPPLDLRREYLTEKLVLKMMSQNRSKEIDKLYHNINKPYWRYKRQPLIVKSFQYLQQFQSIVYQDEILPCYSGNYELRELQIPVHYLSSKLTNAEAIYSITQRCPNFEYIYTDGSKIEENTGCAFYHDNEVHKLFKLPNETSVYTAELIAILEAIKYAKEHDKMQWAILTDSKSSIDSIRKINLTASTSPIIIKILEEVQLLIDRNKTITFIWIKGHNGLEGNEKVDKLAKQATSEGVKDRNVKIPATDLQSTLKSKQKRNWQIRYTREEKVVRFHRVQKQVYRKPWFKDSSERLFVKTINRIRCGHGLYPEYKHKIGIENSPYCHCGKLGTLNHVLWECQQFERQNQDFVKELVEAGVKLPTNLDTLLYTRNINIYYIIYKHLKRMKKDI